MDIRPAADADLPEIARIAAANDEEYGQNPGYVAHLRAHGRFTVAPVDDGLAGYCAVRQTAEVTLLADLFVDPARHGGGTGRQLLDATLGDGGERATFASRDPRAMSLYVRYGMVPRWPLLYLAGRPGGPGTALRAERVPAAEAAAAELALTGRDRAPDHGYWATLPGATGLVVRDGGTVVAAGAATPEWVFHLVTADGCDPVATLAAAVAACPADRVSLCLPGPHPALPGLLGGGWRIEDFDHHMSSRPDVYHPSSVLSPSLG